VGGRTEEKERNGVSRGHLQPKRRMLGPFRVAHPEGFATKGESVPFRGSGEKGEE
jgi:hypothetical protein